MTWRFSRGCLALLSLELAACGDSVAETDVTIVGDVGGSDARIDAEADAFVPTACDSNLDCAGGELCRDGTCVESCGVADSCTGALPICDEAAGVCVGCLADADCTGDLVCDPVSQRCVAPECVSDDDCGGGFTCDAGSCTPIDDIVCDALQSRCDGDNLVTCSRDGTREDSIPCDAREVCEDDGSGMAACRPLICVPNEVACIDDFTAGLCNATGTVVDELPCRDDQYCDTGLCVARVCDPGASTCEGDVAVVCDARGSAATSTACATTPDCLAEDFGCACAGGDCVARTCLPGTSQCVGNASRTCNDAGTAWLPLDLCDDDALCVAGSCIDVVCEPGAVECAGESVATCGDDGTTRELVNCGDSGQICGATDDGATCVDRVCAPLVARCASGREAVLTCDARGSSETERACGDDQYCDGGACLPRVCSPDGPVCRAGDVQRCNTRGSAWELVTDCRDADCEGGECQFTCGDPDIEPNPCGGCVALPLLGTACGPCGLDAYVCDGGDAVACDGATLASACGGCTPLPLLGTSCGPCGLDQYACSGTEGVACDGSTRANACGGCTALPLLGDACGPCLLDEYVCDGAETVECDGATPPSNGCGGCSPLPLLGQPCGPCSLDEYICNGASSVACDGATPCPLGALGEACTIDSDCASGACSEESDDADARRCVPRLFGSTPTQLDFSYVPPGSFAMGTPEDEIGALDTDESPVSVTFSRHLAVSRTEITQGQWMRAAGATNPSRFVACGDACPVEMLDWFAAAAYANWLSNNDGDLQTSPCYTFTPTTCADSQLDWADGDTDCTGATFAGLSCTGYRLLSDAEWEYAARAGTTTATYWNPSTSEPTGGILQSPFGCDPQPALEPIAWYCENAAVTTHEVSLLLANAWGLYDMLGNVNEWTTDWNVTPLPGGLDPLNPAGSGTRLMRGGSWFATARGLRVSWRYAFAPTSRVDDLGFRVARSLPTPPRSVALGERCAADVDCESGACSEESAGTENDRCVPRFFDGESAQMDLSYVPAGTFVMGSPATEPARGTGVLDETQVSVTITRPFAMTNTEITEGQWLQATGSTNPTAWPICGETCPINSIDWYAAAAYANWLNDNDGDPATTSCYSFTPTTCADAIVDWGDGDTDCTGASFAGVACTGYRLPTEAEWEFAARAGTTAATYWNGATSAPTGGGVVFPYGCDPQPNIEPIAWYCENTSRVQPSAELQPNAWGLHDMLGNVWEWTNDGTSGPPPGGIDPVGGGPTGNRMMRGSSYSGRADSLRSAYRNALAPSSRNLAVGFRLVRVLP